VSERARERERERVRERNREFFAITVRFLEKEISKPFQCLPISTFKS